jgi:hypothetical protein
MRRTCEGRKNRWGGKPIPAAAPLWHSLSMNRVAVFIPESILSYFL